jgi:GNAT superfamily N-acetyltransferase
MPAQTPWTPNLKASFGWEAEGDFINPDGSMDGQQDESNLQPRVLGWHGQDDGTTGFELVSPCWDSLHQAADSIKAQYSAWIAAHGKVPLFQNQVPHGNLHSSGHHIHIGKGRRTYLDRDELDAMGEHFRLILPLIGAISASPFPSRRGYGTYAYSILATTGRHRLNFADDHYCELSHNEDVGTGEVRLPDPNIPQCALTNLYLLTHISEHARENCHCTPAQLAFDTAIYESERNAALAYGIPRIPLVKYLSLAKEWMGNFANNLELASIRDVLFMASKYASSPHSIYMMMRPSLYSYMRTMILNPHEYLANLVEVTDGNNKRQAESWLGEAQSITNMQQLIDLAEVSMGALQRAIPTMPRVIASTAFTLLRSEVQSALARQGAATISRILDAGMPENIVREKIAWLLSHGEGFTNAMTVEEVSRIPARFYVMTAPNTAGNRRDMVGCIAINVGSQARRDHTSEVGHLAVHRMYRRLGIGNRLIAHVKGIAIENGIARMHTHIKAGNATSERLFASAGYSVEAVSAGGDTKRWVLQLVPSAIPATARVELVDAAITASQQPPQVREDACTRAQFSAFLRRDMAPHQFAELLGSDADRMYADYVDSGLLYRAWFTQRNRPAFERARPPAQSTLESIVEAMRRQSEEEARAGRRA